MGQCKPGTDMLRVLGSGADCCFSRACTVQCAERGDVLTRVKMGSECRV